MAEPGGFEKERGAYVLARAGRSPAARRRGERLMIRGRRVDSEAAGARDFAITDATTRNLFHRCVFREEGAGNIIGWFAVTVLWMGLVLMLIGPALGFAWAIYGIWYTLRDYPFGPQPDPNLPETSKRKPFRLGPLHPKPLIVAGAIIAVAGGVSLVIRGGDFFAWWLLTQPAVGFLRAAWLTRAYGWPTVTAQVKRASGAIQAVEVGPKTQNVPSEPSAPITPIEVAGLVNEPETNPVPLPVDIAPIEIEIPTYEAPDDDPGELSGTAGLEGTDADTDYPRDDDPDWGDADTDDQEAVYTEGAVR